MKRRKPTRKANASRLSVPERHQLKIARDTLRMPDAMVGVMGGPTKAEAREIFRRLMAKARGVKSNPRRRGNESYAVAKSGRVISQFYSKKVNADRAARKLGGDVVKVRPGQVLAGGVLKMNPHWDKLSVPQREKLLRTIGLNQEFARMAWAQVPKLEQVHIAQRWQSHQQITRRFRREGKTPRRNSVVWGGRRKNKSIEQLGPGRYRADNEHGTTLELIKKPWGWEVQSENAATRAWRGRLGGARTYKSLAEVEKKYKAFRGISQLVNENPRRRNAAVKVERRGTYQGVRQYGITGQSEITPSHATAKKWAALENAARRKNQRAGETITVGKKKFTIHATSDDGSSPNLQRELASKGIRRQLFATPAKGGTMWVINMRADGSLGKPRKINPRRKNETPQEIIRAFGLHRFPKTGTAVDSIRAGDRVTIVNRQGQKSTGRAVMPSSNGGWVLNMGGAHGTPGIATAENIVKVTKRKNSKRNTVAWGSGDQNYMKQALSQLFPGKQVWQLTPAEFSQVAQLAQALKKGKKNPVRKVAGGWRPIGTRGRMGPVFTSQRDAEIYAESLRNPLPGLTYGEALELGAKAFRDGKKRVPVHDRELIRRMYPKGSRSVPIGTNTPNFTAWLKGWDSENMRAGNPRRLPNYGEGNLFNFHGAYREKADAVAKEAKVPGAFIKDVWFKAGPRYGVLTRRAQNAATCGFPIGRHKCSRKPNHRGPHLPQGATLRPRSRVPSKWVGRKNARRRNWQERITEGSRVAIITANEPTGPYSIRLYVNGGETATLMYKKAKTLAGARKIGQKMLDQHIRGNPRRRNYEDAADLYEQFHGKESTRVTDTHLPIADYDDHPELGQLGRLVSLTIGDEEAEKPWKKKIQWNAGEAPDLAAEPGGKQLYIIGGSQDLDSFLESLPVDAEKKELDLGEAYRIEYLTQKGFDNFQHVTYYHDLGEETGERPRVVYDRVKKRIHIVGGAYEVKPEGIVN